MLSQSEHRNSSLYVYDASLTLIDHIFLIPPDYGDVLTPDAASVLKFQLRVAILSFY